LLFEDVHSSDLGTERVPRHSMTRPSSHWPLTRTRPGDMVDQNLACRNQGIGKPMVTIQTPAALLKTLLGVLHPCTQSDDNCRVVPQGPQHLDNDWVNVGQRLVLSRFDLGQAIRTLRRRLRSTSASKPRSREIVIGKVYLLYPI
jgi:hypothetical protein